MFGNIAIAKFKKVLLKRKQTILHAAIGFERQEAPP